MSKIVKNVAGEIIQIGSEICTTEPARGGPRKVTYKIQDFGTAQCHTVRVFRWTKFGWGKSVTRTMKQLDLKLIPNEAAKDFVEQMMEKDN